MGEHNWTPAGGKAKRLAEVCSENPESMHFRIYQVFEKWEEEHMDGLPTPIPPGVFRPWCGSMRLREFAFEISLTVADLGFLRELGIAW